MAANYWKSSQYRSWIFKEEELIERFNVSGSVTREEYGVLIIYFNNIIKIIGQRLHFPERVVSTAWVYLKRFYYKKLFCDYDPWLISPACLFLATKTEEYIMVSNYFLTQVKKQFHWKYTPNDFFSAELQILEALNYDLIIFHAYKPLLVYTEKAELDENCIQCAWSLLNGTYSSNLCLQYHPYMIALSCLFLAALNTENDVTGWFSELNISIEDLKSISEKILKIHQQIEQSLNDKHHYEKNVTQILNKIKKKIKRLLF